METIGFMCKEEQNMENNTMEKIIQLAMENAELRAKLEVLKRVIDENASNDYSSVYISMIKNIMGWD